VDTAFTTWRWPAWQRRPRDGAAAALAVRAQLLAIRENERRARFLGIAVERHLWMSFVVSCAFVSLAGTLYALLNNFTDRARCAGTCPAIFVIMAVLGDALVLGAAGRGRNFCRSAGLRFEPHRELDVVVGLVFVLVVLFFPRGCWVAARTGHS